LEAALVKADELRISAHAAHSKQESFINIILAKSPGLKAELDGREEGRVAAFKTAKTNAEWQYHIIDKNLSTAKDQLSRTKREKVDALSSERKTFTDARAQARVHRDQKFAEIDDSIKKFQAAQAELVIQREQARDNDLANAGVDTVQLNKAKKEHDQIASTIAEIESHSNLVREWEDWLETQGQSRFVDAEVKFTRAQEEVAGFSDKLDGLEKSHKKQMFDLDRDERNRGKSLSTANGEIDTLNSLNRDLSEFPASGASTLTEGVMASELKGQCTLQLEKLNSIRRDVHTKLQKTERELCEVECSTKEFVIGVMNESHSEDESDITRAEKMVRLYDRIPREVVVNVNTSLSTILGNISEYRKTILTFESEVKRFNNDLQAGLKNVSQNFERFSDFSASVVTDFDKIDFVGKLKLLDEVVIEHRGQHQSTYSLDVPPAGTAEALRSFMTAMASGTMEINLSKHITLSGSVTDDGIFKTFHNATQLEQLSSNGLTAIALISLLCGLLNVIRGSETIYIPWATDEVGRFDPDNFQRLMVMLKDNHIDAVTASPALTPAAYRNFSQRYAFRPRGVIAEYKPRDRGEVISSAEIGVSV
jgi:Protein of unknown function (DUF3584)